MERTARLNSLITQTMNEIIFNDIHDPRLHMVTVNESRITRDLKHCKVYVSVLPCENMEERVAEVKKGLESARGFIKRELGARIRIRFIPELYFIYDESIKRGVEILSLIDRVIRDDKGGGGS